VSILSLKFVRIIPFIVLMIILANTLYSKLSNNYSIESKYLVSGVLLWLNLIFYKFNYKAAIFLTLIIILLAMFNSIWVFYSIDEFWFSLLKNSNGNWLIKAPGIDLRMLLILFSHLLINSKLIIRLLKAIENKIVSYMDKKGL